MMKNWISMTLLSLLCLGASATTVNFYEGDLLAARQKAQNEGKMFFVDFYANWCMPCKWMDQTTFSDPEVGRLMNDEFISVKVNIDDLVGFDLSQKYDVQVLPTLLIFNDEGQMIERIEETLTPSRMLGILRKHVSSESKPLPAKRSVNRSPRADAPSAASPPSETSAPESGLYRVQMGAFTQYDAASRKVADLQNQFLEPIVVVNEVVEGQVVFKILMGQFATKSEAASFQQILKQKYNLESFVR